MQKEKRPANVMGVCSVVHQESGMVCGMSKRKRLHTCMRTGGLPRMNPIVSVFAVEQMDKQT